MVPNMSGTARRIGEEAMSVSAERRAELTREQLRFIYDRMTLIREFEERLKKLVDTGPPVGAVHHYSGAEAVAVGVCAALEPGGWITSTHRGHGHCIADRPRRGCA